MEKIYYRSEKKKNKFGVPMAPCWNLERGLILNDYFSELAF